MEQTILFYSHGISSQLSPVLFMPSSGVAHLRLWLGRLRCSTRPEEATFGVLEVSHPGKAGAAPGLPD